MKPPIPRAAWSRRSASWIPSLAHRSLRPRFLHVSRAHMADQQGPPQPPMDYTSWSTEQLVARVTELEQLLKEQNAKFTSPTNTAPTTSTIAAAAAATPASDFTHTPSPRNHKANKAARAFDPSRYQTRLIALKFAYLGARYNGYEHHAGNRTPLPTVEEELWKALRKTHLIFPLPREEEEGKKDGAGAEPERKKPRREPSAAMMEPEVPVNWNGVEYSKCGRTDRGVSAFGQVIGVRVRSSRPAERPVGEEVVEGEGDGDAVEGTGKKEKKQKEKKEWDPIADELPYIQLLNRVLPPDIRVLAWCPNPPPGFSARFSCRERRYRYFFTNPAFAPAPAPAGESGGAGRGNGGHGWLDIEAMRAAAAKLVGVHDFRNLCKVDASKQITNFERRIFYAGIEEVAPLEVPAFLRAQVLQPAAAAAGAEGTTAPLQEPKVYAFCLYGSAFLWHQVRHIVAVLFLVGQGLEKPEVLDELMDTSRNPTKPHYDMASDVPLVLWDCIFPDLGQAVDPAVKGRARMEVEEREGFTGHTDSLEWVYVGEGGGGAERGGNGSEALWGNKGGVPELWSVWRKAKMAEVLAASLLDLVGGKGVRMLEGEKEQDEGSKAGEGGRKNVKDSVKVFDGGEGAKLAGKYVPLMQRERMEDVSVINRRWRERKGLPEVTEAADEMDVDE